jgi:lysophospholipase L1-like esterase
MIVRSRLRFPASALTTITALTLLLLSVIATPASAARTIRYVALGDSYSSGPLIPLQRTDPLGCYRSDHNYPSLLAAALRVRSFTDVSCSGATTVDMTNPQALSVPGEQNAPQFDALTKDTTLVTITIGGNDIGFVQVATTCAHLAATDPFGAPCQAHYTAGGTDQVRARIAAAASKVAAVVRGIHTRSPRAKVIVLGYLRILPPSGTCSPIVPFAKGDMAYLDGIEQDLNEMIATQADENDVRFVDTYTPSLGHDACQLPGTKWVEGFIPLSPAAPLHPNAMGMAAVKEFVLDELR